MIKMVEFRVSIGGDLLGFGNRKNNQRWRVCGFISNHSGLQDLSRETRAAKIEKGNGESWGERSTSLASYVDEENW